MSNSTQNETHNVCNEQLALLGGNAPCCGCFPHEGCTLGDHVPDFRKMIDRALQEDYMTADGGSYIPNKKLYTQQGLDKAVADARKGVIDSIDSFDLVEPCVPDCTPKQHAYHKGTWDSQMKLQKLLATLREEEST